MSTPNVGYGFVPCSHDDPKRSHYLFCDSWKEAPCGSRIQPCAGCAETLNRKPVEIPDGWELVPEDSTVVFGDKLLDKCGPVCTAGVSVGKRAGSEILANIGAAAFIRRKIVQPTVEPSKPAVDWSKPLQTRDGRKARLLGVINARRRTHVVAITMLSGLEIESRHYPTGLKNESSANCKDDIINTTERIKREVWLNVYESGGITPWADKDTADTHALEGRIACVRVQIDCNVGEGL
jgi:hypothetical protein